MFSKLFNAVMLCSILFFTSCSEESTVGPPIEPPIDETPKYLFTVETNARWLMKNKNNDTAFFQAFDTTIISVANLFWDTSEANRIEMKAIPVRFRYWEGNMRRDIWFALGITDSGYVFCSNRNSVISDFPLDNFYSKLFFIPNEVQNERREYVYDEFIIGTSTFRVSAEALWKNIDEIFWQEKKQKLWRVEYKSTDEMKVPSQYFYDFEFLQDIGFYKYMNYELVELN